MSGVAFLTSPRNLSPITSRMRFEAIDNLRVEWDLDYDPKLGQLNSDNLFAGYSWGRTTVGLGHALLNAVDENGSSASTIQSQQLQPFLSIGKPTAAQASTLPPTPAMTSSSARCNMPACRPSTTGTAAASPSATVASSWLHPRRNPISLQLHPGQLRLSRRHPPLQLRLPRPHPPARLLTAGCLSFFAASTKCHRAGNPLYRCLIAQAGVSFSKRN